MDLLNQVPSRRPALDSATIPDTSPEAPLGVQRRAIGTGWALGEHDEVGRLAQLQRSSPRKAHHSTVERVAEIETLVRPSQGVGDAKIRHHAVHTTTAINSVEAPGPPGDFIVHRPDPERPIRGTASIVGPVQRPLSSVLKLQPRSPLTAARAKESKPVLRSNHQAIELGTDSQGTRPHGETPLTMFSLNRTEAVNQLSVNVDPVEKLSSGIPDRPLPEQTPRRQEQLDFRFHVVAPSPHSLGAPHGH